MNRIERTIEGAVGVALLVLSLSVMFAGCSTPRKVPAMAVVDPGSTKRAAVTSCSVFGPIDVNERIATAKEVGRIDCVRGVIVYRWSYRIVGRCYSVTVIGD